MLGRGITSHDIADAHPCGRLGASVTPASRQNHGGQPLADIAQTGNQYESARPRFWSASGCQKRPDHEGRRQRIRQVEAIRDLRHSARSCRASPISDRIRKPASRRHYLCLDSGFGHQVCSTHRHGIPLSFTSFPR